MGEVRVNIMKHSAKLFLSLAVPMICLGNKPEPLTGEFMLLDRILGHTASQSETSTIALGVLKQVAMGETNGISPDTEIRVGLEPGRLRRPEFSAPSVRGYAFRKIGETGLPETVDFLQSLKQADFAGDTSQQIWPAAQIALKDALLRGIVDPQSRVNFLEKILTDSRGNPARGAVAIWAFNHLCDRGALASLPLIQRFARAKSNIKACVRISRESFSGVSNLYGLRYPGGALLDPEQRRPSGERDSRFHLLLAAGSVDAGRQWQPGDEHFLRHFLGGNVGDWPERGDEHYHL
jgi:hypothetical protein